MDCDYFHVLVCRTQIFVTTLASPSLFSFPVSDRLQPDGSLIVYTINDELARSDGSSSWSAITAPNRGTTTWAIATDILGLPMIRGTSDGSIFVYGTSVDGQLYPGPGTRTIQRFQSATNWIEVLD